eukprot:1078010-Amphidinium_carterae.1
MHQVWVPCGSQCEKGGPTHGCANHLEDVKVANHSTPLHSLRKAVFTQSQSAVLIWRIPATTPHKLLFFVSTLGEPTIVTLTSNSLCCVLAWHKTGELRDRRSPAGKTSCEWAGKAVKRMLTQDLWGGAFNGFQWKEQYEWRAWWSTTSRHMGLKPALAS